jgi:hypothetical protein
LWPRRLAAALRTGATGVLGVVATTATAGIIVGVVMLLGALLVVLSLNDGEPDLEALASEAAASASEAKG